MAEQAKDGSLIFDTKIDTTGFEKDIEKLGKTELDLNVNVDTTVVKETFESFGTSAVTLDLSTTAAVQQYRETVASMEQREIETKITLNVESVEDAINAYEPPTKELAIDVAVDDIEEPLGKLSEKLVGWKQKMAGVLEDTVKGLIGNGLQDMAVQLYESLKDAADMGDKVDKQSQAMGLSCEGYQEWGYILKQNGTDIQNLQGGMSILNTVLKKAATGNKDASIQFEKLGLNVGKLNSMSREDAFETIVTALQGVKDEGEKAALATALFGDSANDLLPTLNQTVEETAALKREAHDLGAVMSDEGVDASVKMNEELGKMQTAWQGLSTQLMTLVMPLFTGIFDTVSKVVGGIASLFGGSGKVGLSEEVRATITDFENVKQEINDIKTNYSTAMVEIEVKYRKSKELVAELEALIQGKASAEEIKTVCTALVTLYPGLKGYMGEGGIISAERGQLEGLIEKWKKLDEQIAFSNMVIQIEGHRSEMKNKVDMYQEMYDDAYKKWTTAKESVEAINKLTSDFGHLELFDIYDNADIAERQQKAAQEFAKNFEEMFKSIDKSDIPNINELIFTMTPEAMAADQEASDHMTLLTQRMNDKLYEMQEIAKQSMESASADATGIYELIEKGTAECANAAIEVEALQKVALKKAGMTQEQINQAVKNGKTVEGLYNDMLKKAGIGTGALEADNARQSNVVKNMENNLDDVKTITDETDDVVIAQQKEIDQLSTQALTVEELTTKINEATTAGVAAQTQLAAAKTAVTADAQTILTDMTTFITALGVDVAAMVQTMNDIVADGEIGAAEAGKAFAQGAARGYRAETPLRDAVEDIIRQAISHMNGFLQVFCGVGASMVQSIADGVTAEGGVLQSAMRGVVANALAAAQNAMGSAASLGRVNRWYPKRTGLEYVPYDEYPALLHKGESVLTAAEAALWRGGQTAVRESAAASAVLDYHALASAIWEAAPEGQAPVIALDGAVVGRM
ncbi:MAG: hypothetical protein RSI33_13115, partial [Clostridia bacterium]